MSLTARVSAFLLVALAVVLAGFSVGLYLLARTYLYRQLDERLEAALDTLAAAAEIQDGHVEWEPDQRQLPVGRDPAEGQVRWVVRDGRGRTLDRSPNLAGADLPGDRPGYAVDAEGRRWRVLRRTVRPGGVSRTAAEAPARHDQLVLTVGATAGGLERSLSSLALALGGLSAGLLLLAALLARRLCRRVLRPLTDMTGAVRTMSPDDLGARLPGPGTGDELEQLGRAFNELLARVEEAFERQRRFTGDASHQLRTPLAVLLGQLELALRRERPAAEYREALAAAREQAERLRRIVEALLFLARADREARLPDLEDVQPGVWLTEQLRHWDGHPRRADLHVELPAGQPCRVRVHASLLGQLLDNLLDNACKYSAPGSPVTVRLGAADGAATLAVEDAGTGIDPEDLPHLFEPFYRSARARREGRTGVGLGLAVARRIAEALGGTLVAESVPGQGARFLLRLPACESGDG